MALSMHAALPCIVPAVSSFSSRIKEHKHYSCVFAARSLKVPSPVVLTRVKSSQTAFMIMSTISEKDDKEIQVKLTKVQNACKKLKGIVGDIILVIMATNPLLQCLSDALDSNDRFLRWSSIGASYGAFAVLKEFAKVLCKSQPVWGFVIVGFLIYKANMCNIALYRKGRYPVWLGSTVLSVLLLGKAVDDFSWTVYLGSSKVPSPLNFIWAVVEIMTSVIMSSLFIDDSIMDQKATCADKTLASVPRRRRRQRRLRKTICRRICSKRL